MAKKATRKIAAKDADQYMLRLPPGMRDAVASLADSNGRSINTEIIAAIEQHLKGPSRMDRVEAFVEKHRKMIDELAEIDWDGVFTDIERLRERAQSHDEQLNPQRYDRD